MRNPILFIVIMLLFVSTQTANGQDPYFKIEVTDNYAVISTNFEHDNTGFIINQRNINKKIFIVADYDGTLKFEKMDKEGNRTSEDQREFTKLVGGNKDIKGIIQDGFGMVMSLENQNVKFKFNEKEFGEIIFINSEFKSNLVNCNETFKFIPDLSIKSIGEWPSYIVESDDNIDYRFAIDFSNSFSHATLWKLKKEGTSFSYTRKSVLKPRHLRYISLSIKNYHLLYDSVVTSTSFNNYNLEGGSIFTSDQKFDESFQSQFIIDDPEPPRATGSGDIDRIEKLLNKLDLDLVEYYSCLLRNIVDKSMWNADLQYINSRLKECIQLTDFTPNGLQIRLTEMTSKSNLENKDELIRRIVTNYSKIQSYSILTTPPVQIKDQDVFTYNLKFYKDGRNVETREYDFLIRGGLKIDFSAGFSYGSLNNEYFQIINAGTTTDTTFYVDAYFNTTDSILDIQTINLKKIEPLKNDINIGITALMHFYSRTGTYLNFGGTFGFMLNTRAEFHYLIGGSIIMGQKQRMILSGGAAVGKVDRLNKKYKTDFAYKENQLGPISDSQVTVQEWEWGYFISLTYNLGKIK